MTKVEIANGWTDPAGEFHKAETVIEVEPGVARDLISRGKARLPESASAAEKPASPKPELEPKPEAVKPAPAAKEAGKNG